MNYLSFFSLEREPFSNAQGTRFYFNSAQHARVVVRMMFAVENMKGLAVVTGPVGTGKSTTARRLLEGLPKERFEAAILTMVQSGVSPLWLLTKIAYLLGVSQPAEDRTRILGQLYRRLYTLHNQGKKAVILIDEAQLLQSPALMEVLRGLLSLEIPERKLLTICLFGLPALEKNLQQDPSLYQRIAVRGRLFPLNRDEAEAYVKHRLKLAGADHMLFTSEAVEAVFQASQGVPRLINTLCDNALFEGFLVRADPVTRRILMKISAEMGYGSEEPDSRELQGLSPSPVREPAMDHSFSDFTPNEETRTSRARSARVTARRLAASTPKATYELPSPKNQRFELRRGLPRQGALPPQEAAPIPDVLEPPTEAPASSVPTADALISEVLAAPPSPPASPLPEPVSTPIKVEVAPQKQAVAPPPTPSPVPSKKAASWIDNFDPSAATAGTEAQSDSKDDIDSLLSNLKFDPEEEKKRPPLDPSEIQTEDLPPETGTQLQVSEREEVASGWRSRLFSWGKVR